MCLSIVKREILRCMTGLSEINGGILKARFVFPEGFAGVFIIMPRVLGVTTLSRSSMSKLHLGGVMRTYTGTACVATNV